MIETTPHLLQQLSFWLLAAVMVASALGIVFHRSIVYSALFMLATFMAIAGVFALLNAPFLAAAQIMVYGVGLTIVMIFGIMLTGDKVFTDPEGQGRSVVMTKLVPFVCATVVGGLFIMAIVMPHGTPLQLGGVFAVQTPQAWLETATGQAGFQAIVADGGITHIAKLLFQKYLIPFELASVLLLLAMVGSILLSIRRYPEEMVVESADSAADPDALTAPNTAPKAAVSSGAKVGATK